MQRQGGGKQRGGGNDPTCGCDMQAGWPSASTFPRGGLQGGGIQEANFSFSLKNNQGKVHNYKGRVARSNKMKTMKTTMSSAGNEYKPIVYKGKRAYKSMTTGNMFTRRKNGTLGSPIKTPASNRNSLKPTTMAPPPVEPETIEMSEPIEDNNNNNTMNNNTINNNNNNMNNNNSNNNNSMSDPGSPEYDTESAENNTNEVNVLSQQMGGRRRTHRRKHGKRCPCMLCYFKKLKLSRKRRH